jgi:hypothetical protein
MREPACMDGCKEMKITLWFPAQSSTWFLVLLSEIPTDQLRHFRHLWPIRNSSIKIKQYSFKSWQRI